MSTRKHKSRGERERVCVVISGDELRDSLLEQKKDGAAVFAIVTRKKIDAWNCVIRRVN